MTNNSHKYPLIIGFLGNGQLAKMCAIEAIKLGHQIRFYGKNNLESPCAIFSHDCIEGEADDLPALIQFCQTCDIVTLENEFFNPDLISQMVKQTNIQVFPQPEVFSKVATKLNEKIIFDSLGIPQAKYQVVNSSQEIEAFAKQRGYPLVLKKSHGGYDGYGNKTIKKADQIESAFSQLKQNETDVVFAEEYIPFEKEVAIQVARNQSQIVLYPVVETFQENHICKKVLAPARISKEIEDQIKDYAKKMAQGLAYVGLFSFEFFVTKTDAIYLNESAPRVHNSGHYTIEGCITSQFENHIRAITGLSLGPSDLRAKSIVMLNLLGTQNGPCYPKYQYDLSTFLDGHLHLYGKKYSRIGRKMGHYTLLAESSNEALNIISKIEQKVDI